MTPYRLGERGSLSLAKLLLLAPLFGIIGITTVFIATRSSDDVTWSVGSFLVGFIVWTGLFGSALLIWRTSLTRSATFGRPLWMAVMWAIFSLAIWPVAILYWRIARVDRGGP